MRNNPIQYIYISVFIERTTNETLTLQQQQQQQQQQKKKKKKKKKTNETQKLQLESRIIPPFP